MTRAFLLGVLIAIFSLSLGLTSAQAPPAAPTAEAQNAFRGGNTAVFTDGSHGRRKNEPSARLQRAEEME